MGNICCKSANIKNENVCIKINQNDIDKSLINAKEINSKNYISKLENSKENGISLIFCKRSSDAPRKTNTTSKNNDNEKTSQAPVKNSSSALVNASLYQKQAQIKKYYFAYLMQMHVFKGVNSEEIKKISNELEEKAYTENEIIINIGDEIVDQLYFIEEGVCSVYDDNNKHLRDLYSYDCFGEFCLISEEQKNTCKIIAKNTTTCLILNKKDCNNLLNDSNFIGNLKKLNYIRNNNINFEDLSFVKFVSKSNYSTSFVVYDKENYYQIKLYDKKALDNNVLPRIKEEKNIALSVNGDYCLRGIKTFKDNERVYILSEYESFSVLKDYMLLKRELFKEYDVRFYFANFISAVEYLHQNKIVHRDIKPLNFNISSNGYLKLNDYYTAKYIGNEQTKTIIGTPVYMAPEVIEGKNYSFSADFWSLGVCLYEFVYGKYPFGNCEQDQTQIFNEILENELDLFNNFDSNSSTKFDTTNVNHLIMKLLLKNTDERTHKFDEIKKHPFFEGFDWNKFYNFEYQGPYIPRNRSLNIENLVSFSDFILKKDKRYFYEDSLANEVILIKEEDENSTLNFDKEFEIFLKEF